MDDFDLRDVLASRKYPTAKVKVWVDEEGFFELAALEQKIANTLDADEVSRLDAQAQKLKDELNASALTVHLRGTSRRAREDMQTEALTLFPIKRDVMGREESLQQVERGRLLTELYFAAHITAVENAAGARQDWAPDSLGRELARAFLSEMPDYSVALVDQAIGALRGESEMQQGVDFLSRT